MAITAAQVKELNNATGVGIMDCKRALTESDGDFDAAVKWLREKGMAKAAKRAAKVASEGVVATFITDGGAKGAMVEVNCETDFVAKSADFGAFVAAVGQAITGSKAADTAALVAATDYGDGRSLQDRLGELAGKCGEKVDVRRFVRYELGGPGVLANYIHMGGKIGILAEIGCDKADVAASDAFKSLANDICLQACAAAPRWLRREDVPAETIEMEMEVYRKQAAESGKPEAIHDKIAQGMLVKWYGENCLLEQPYIRDDKQKVAGLVEATGKALGAKIELRRFVRFERGEGIEKVVSDLAADVAAEMAKFEGK